MGDVAKLQSIRWQRLPGLDERRLLDASISRILTGAIGNGVVYSVRPSGLEYRGRIGMHHLRQARGIPVGQANATVAFRPANCFRLGSAMNAIMWFRQVDPDNADRSVRAGWQQCGVLAVG